MTEHAGSGLIVTVSAISGLLFGFIGSVLGIYNCVKAAGKEKREKSLRASQNLVSAVIRTDKADHGRLPVSLYLINSDAHPVSDVTVVFTYEDKVSPRSIQCSIPSLCATGEYRVRQLRRPVPTFRPARFTYVDIHGIPHSYDQEVYSERL